MSMLNPLAKARGHGSAKDGVHHWYAQRASAVLLILLLGWLVYSLFSIAGGGYEESKALMSHPVNAALLGVLIVTALYHGMLGLQVVIEDYVHSPAVEIILYVLTRAGAYIGMALAVVHILKLALGA
jgi:succinate dehydrogenase / fumarate reductase membrane anchor subunit